MKKAFVILILLGAAGGGAMYYTRYKAANPVTTFRTMAIKRGDLLSTIGATGTVEPEEVIDVGAQVMGTINDLGIDPKELKGRERSQIEPDELEKLKRIDYGSTVYKGTELAQSEAAVEITGVEAGRVGSEAKTPEK